MSLPDFNAEQAVGPATQRYRGRSSYGVRALAAISAQHLDEHDEFEEEDDENGFEDPEAHAFPQLGWTFRAGD